MTFSQKTIPDSVPWPYVPKAFGTFRQRTFRRTFLRWMTRILVALILLFAMSRAWESLRRVEFQHAFSKESGYNLPRSGKLQFACGGLWSGWAKFYVTDIADAEMDLLRKEIVAKTSSHDAFMAERIKSSIWNHSSKSLFDAFDELPVPEASYFDSSNPFDTHQRCRWIIVISPSKRKMWLYISIGTL